MKTIILGLSLACATCICFAQVEEPLCPRHIETPDYPAIARMAHLTGKVSLTLTIDAEGNVTNAKAKAESKTKAEANVPGENEILETHTLSNIRKWTFAKPPTAPYIETMTYDYKMDETGRTEGTIVTFDLPSQVTILSGPTRVMTISQSKKHN